MSTILRCLWLLLAGRHDGYVTCDARQRIARMIAGPGARSPAPVRRCITQRSSGADAVLSALGPLNAEQTLGRYELLTPIGRGGTAVVWAARPKGNRGLSGLVAVKIMLPHLSADPRFEQMFLREATIASRIHHANVCEILDLGEDDGVLFLAMQWIDGDSLATVMTALDGVPPPIGPSVRLIADAGRGLHVAHGLHTEGGEPLGVVHRDVSPQNVLVTADGSAKIVDFGIAKAATGQEQTTLTGFIKGKVAYVAPEQINGAPVDARTDVFALGVILYELTVGTHPFRGATELATLLAIASTDPARRPSDVVASYPSDLEAVVTKAIEKDPAERYPSMAAMVAALDAFLEVRIDSAEERAAENASWLRVLAALRSERRARLHEASIACDERSRSRSREACMGIAPWSSRRRPRDDQEDDIERRRARARADDSHGCVQR